MSADALLSRLDRVKCTGRGRWVAPCPAHDDRTPSLSIRELDDGRILLHDFGGCDVESVLAAVGLKFDDLFPPRPPKVEGVSPERRPWMPADVFEVVRLEVSIAALIASDMHKGKEVSEQDYERLLAAAGRLERVAEAAYRR